MSNPTAYLMFIVGLVLVIKGADWFVEAAVWMAKKTGMPEVLVGATIVSVGTTLPELAVSTFSSFTGYPDVALGNAVGSCIFNIAVILGLSIAIRPLEIEGKLFSTRALIMLAAAVLATVLSIDGDLERIDGVILLAGLATYIIYLVRSQRSVTDEQDTSAQEAQDAAPPSSSSDKPGHIFPSTTPGQVLQFIAGALAVAIGSRFTVSAATTIAEMLGVPEIVIGLTIVAIGTSMPELATAITALAKGHQSLSAGNVVGANFLNMTAVLGFSSLVNRVPIAGSSLLLDFPVMLALIAALTLFASIGRKLTRWQGIVFLVAYIAYTAVQFGRG